MSFKDVGAAFMASCLGYFNRKNTKMPFYYTQKQLEKIAMLVFITLIEQDVIKLSKNINKLMMMHAIQFN